MSSWRELRTFRSGNRQALDAEEDAELVNDKQGPLDVGNKNEDEVAPEKVVFGVCREDGIHLEHHSDVGDESTQNQGNQLDGEVREGHLGNVGQDDLGGHATKHNANCDGKQDKVLLLEDVRMGRGQPSVGTDKEERDGQQLGKGGDHRLVLLLAGPVHRDHTGRNVTNDKQECHACNQEIQQDPVLRDDAKVGAKESGSVRSPEQGSLESRDQHDDAGDNKTFSGTVDVAKVQHTSVVFLPSRQEEGQCGKEQKECCIP